MKSEIAFEKKYLILWHFCNFLIYRFSSSSFVAVCLTKGFSSEQSLTANEKKGRKSYLMDYVAYAFAFL